MNPEPEVLLQIGVPNVYLIRFESITAEDAQKATIETKRGSGPLGLDADVWQKILSSTS